MKKLLLIQILCLGLLVTPLMANKGCSDALQEAEDAANENPEDPSPDQMQTDPLPTLPDDPEVLRGSGPEVISPHVE